MSNLASYWGLVSNGQDDNEVYFHLLPATKFVRMDERFTVIFSNFPALQDSVYATILVCLVSW